MSEQTEALRLPSVLKRTIALLERLAKLSPDDWPGRGIIANEARKILDELRAPPARENGA